MKQANINSVLIAIGVILSVSIFQSCQQQTSSNASTTDNIDSLKQIALQLVGSNDTIASHLKTFDELDFDVFSNQKWDRLKESHTQNIKVYWPDGHVTEGINVHIEDLKKLFIHAPDTRIKEHPIKFGSGDYTLVTEIGRAHV